MSIINLLKLFSIINFTLANQAMDLKLTLANRKCYLHPCRIVIPCALLIVKRDIFVSRTFTEHKYIPDSSYTSLFSSSDKIAWILPSVSNLQVASSCSSSLQRSGCHLRASLWYALFTVNITRKYL